MELKNREIRKKSDKMIYFTSDQHLGHPAIIPMQNRPFVNVDEMNRTIINNYNSIVHKNDTVYILGDICHHLKIEAANELIAELKGRKILIAGNHDKKYDERLFQGIYDFKTVSLYGKVFVLMHYPMLSWPGSYRGSYQLHGHIHARNDYNQQNIIDGIRRYDVGVDANDFYPVSVEQIIEFFGKKIKKMKEQGNNIFIINLDMGECSPEEIAREAVMKIAEITDKLIEQQNNQRQEEL